VKVYVFLDKGASLPFLVDVCGEDGRWLLKIEESYGERDQAMGAATRLAKKYRCEVVDCVPMLDWSFKPYGGWR